MPFLLFLLSVATLVAVSSKSKVAPRGGTTQTFTLDANIPEPLRNQVLAALVSGTDPATLDAFATAIQAQYPLSAALLHAKAASLRSGLPSTPTTPSLPPTTDPGGPPLDASMPPAMVAFVHTELATEADPIKLMTLANTIAAQYPIAASLLAQRAAVLNVQPQPSPIPQPSPSPIPAPAPSPAPEPANPPAPALNMPGLDPGMPPDLAQAVMGALVSENDPAKLQALAQEVGPKYPLAANLLAAKANTLLALRQQPSPTPQPTPGVPSGPLMGMDPGMPPETVQLVLNELANEGDPTKLQALADELAAKYPIAAGLLRTRANVILATRPPIEIIPSPSPTPTPTIGTTYTVEQGDYPWKIAAKLTGHGTRWPELVAANSNKPRGKDGNFATLLPGEKLTLPVSWSASPPPSATVATSPTPPAPRPVISPAPSPADGVALDANMPPEVAAAVRNALKSATDPNQVRGFASAINTQYPRAADLLNAKANALASLAPSNGTVLANTHPGQALAPAATYKVKPGDSPSKIAAALAHDGNRWKELVAANPQKKRAANGNFASLVPGELLQLPASWANGAPSKPTSSPQGGA